MLILAKYWLDKCGDRIFHHVSQASMDELFMGWEQVLKKCTHVKLQK